MKKIFSILFVLVLVVSLGLATAPPVLASGTIIHVPQDYPTIQAAINASSDGDTIMVAAGLYKENVVINRALTLKGAQAGVDARTRSGNETIIQPDGGTGISIRTANRTGTNYMVVIDGLTVRNVVHAITTPDPEVAADIIVKNVRALNSSEFGISLTFTTKTTVEYCYVEGAKQAINAGALEPFPPTVATLRNNEVVNAEFGITGYMGDSLIEGNLIRDFATGGTGISGQFLNTQVKHNTITGYVKGAGMGFESHYGRPLSENVNVESNNFTKNSFGIYVFDTQTKLTGIAVNFNNIFDNSWFGVRNDGNATLDATRNWWGANDGPGSAGPGTGDAVSAHVDFEPWLGAAPVTLKTETVTDDTVDAKDEADTEVAVNGTAAVTVAQLAGNPGGKAPTGFGALGKYIDVYVPDTTKVTELQIRLYYTDAELTAAGISEEESLRLFSWNGTAWVQCSDSGVNTTSANGYSGYMWAKIRADTTPSLTNLQGEEFGGYGHPSSPPKPCFIATAAYGTATAKEIDILREFRDAVLLPNSLSAKFVSLYYKTSPPIANFISQHEVLRTVVRVGFVDPIVKILNWSHDLWSAGGS
ncbi:MAG: right-handed parallel beta-helix repeat-containing protein [Dehalococcoidia bacterium]